MTAVKNNENTFTEVYTESFIIHKQMAENIMTMAPLHSHEYIEVLYTFGGKFNIWLDGKFYEFSKGDLVVINSRELHCIETSDVKKGDGYYCLRFNPNILYGSDNTIYEFKYVLPFLANHTPPQKVFTAAELEKTEVEGLIKNIYSEYLYADYAYELSIRSDICRLFTWILRYWKSRNYDITSEINLDLASKLQKTIDFVLQNYGDEITAEKMAEYSNLSYSYFSRSFKQLTGKSFTEYLNYIRVSESEKLLLTTDMNITEIALCVGFSTSSYFIQQFKLYKKMSPKQFKKEFLKGAAV